MDDHIKVRFRQMRGQVSEQDIKIYETAAPFELEHMLTDADPKKRTIAATVIGNRRLREFIPALCDGLAEEKALYSRIAMSEALGLMGEYAVRPLIALLGKIGDNQETTLPQKRFGKNSYPLVRDLAARTLVKIGNPALPALIEKVLGGDSYETQQAIDAIGGIVNKTGDKRPLPILLQALNDFEDEVSIWKIVRALSAFQTLEVVKPLEMVLLNHPNAIIRREAARSIGQVGIPTPNVVEVLKASLKDKNKEVKKEVKFSLKLLKRLIKRNALISQE